MIPDLALVAAKEPEIDLISL